MPIVTISLLEDDPPQAVAGTSLQRLADSLGELFGAAKNGVWVSLTYLPRSQYAENGGADPSNRPVFVELLCAEPAEACERVRQAEQIAQRVADHLQRPKHNVHVLYLPAAKGQIAFGGQLS